MGLLELTLRDFRVFRDFTLRPDPDAVTVLLSENGTGKTSVLEGVYALSTAQSFRTTLASDMIRTHQSVAEVHGLVLAGERRVQIDLTLQRGPRNTMKRMLVNGQRPGSRAELASALPVTVFTPEGVAIVRAGPDGRRNFLVTLLGDVRPHTAPYYERFQRVLTQRNAVLRSANGQPLTATKLTELDVWSSEFAELGEGVAQLRHEVIEQLAPLTQAFYRELSGRHDDVTVHYEQCWSGPLAEALAASRQEERHRGYTVVGPHRDDIAITLNGRDARRQASQGEQRSLALALRLAGHALVQNERDVTPLLLLDDVFSELDPLRSDRLLRLLPPGQTLVTTATPLPAAMTPAVIVDVSTMGR